MGRQLIEHYLLLSQEDLHLWETNPEEFGMLYSIKVVTTEVTFRQRYLTILFLFSHWRRGRGVEVQSQGIYKS